MRAKAFEAVHVRLASSDDAEGIAHVYLDAALAQYTGLVPDRLLARLSLGGLTDRWWMLLKTRRRVRVAFVAVDADGHVVGFAAAGVNPSRALNRDGEIYAIYVRPAHQRRGVGRELFAATVRGLEELGLRSSLAWVLAGNPAREFFVHLGGRWIATQVSRVAGTKIAYAWSAE